MSKKLVFVTGNMNKVHWLEKFLGQAVDHRKLDLIEIQSLDPVEVVRHKSIEAYGQIQEPVLIEDTSLVFTALGKLPGTFVKFFLEEIGNADMCRLLDGYTDKSATASVIYGIYDGKNFQSFGKSVEGSISPEPKGASGHGWDPIFIPEGQTKTYAEMTQGEYVTYSVRNKAVQKLKKFIDEERGKI